MRKTGILFLHLALGLLFIIIVLCSVYKVSPGEFFHRTASDRFFGYSYVGLLYVMILEVVTWNSSRPGKGNIWTRSFGPLPWKAVLLTLTGSGLLFVFYLVLMSKAGAARFYVPLRVGPGFFLEALIIGFLFAFGEEILFRGYIQDALLKELPPWAAFAGVNFIFAILHIFRPGDVTFKLTYFAGIFCTGLVLSVVKYRTDTLWTPISIHGFWVFFMYVLPRLVGYRPVSYRMGEVLWGLERIPVAGVLGICIVLLTGFMLIRFARVFNKNLTQSG